MQYLELEPRTTLLASGWFVVSVLGGVVVAVDQLGRELASGGKVCHPELDR